MRLQPVAIAFGGFARFMSWALLKFIIFVTIITLNVIIAFITSRTVSIFIVKWKNVQLSLSLQLRRTYNTLVCRQTTDWI